MARLQTLPPPTMEGREFFYHADMIQRDIAEEEKARARAASMSR